MKTKLIRTLAFLTIVFGMSLSGGTLQPVLAGMPNQQEPGTGSPDVLTVKVDNKIVAGITANILGIVSDANGFDSDVSNLINTTVGAGGTLEAKDYCIVHIVQWQNKKIGKDAWFLYQNTELPTKPPWERQVAYDGKRIYGSKRVAVLLVHVRIPDGTDPDITYKIAINKKTPAPFKNLMTLIGSINPTGGAPGAPPLFNLWGGRLVIVENVPSDMIVSASIALEGEQSKEFTRTYDNEGRYHWDVSLGLPVKTFRELQFNSDGNKVTTSAKERQNVYGFLNLYPKAVDTKADSFLTLPHVVVGVPLATKPLHHPFLGVGAGVYKSPIKFNIFAGVIFHRERVPGSLNVGESATPSQLEADLRTRWVRKFTFGVNFPIGQIKDAIK